MIPYDIYKITHMLGLMILFMSLGGLALHHANGGEKTHPARKRLAISHGIGLFLILLGGFGMAARLGLRFPFPAWMIAKILIWIVLGGSIAFVRKKPVLVWLCVTLGATAACFAIYKPFI